MIDHGISECRDQDNNHPTKQDIPEYSHSIKMCDISNKSRGDDFNVVFHGRCSTDRWDELIGM